MQVGILFRYHDMHAMIGITYLLREALIKKDGAQKENHARMLKRFNKSGEDW